MLCVDMLIFYLIGLVNSDGVFMFWDCRGDGIIDKFEFYIFK